MISMMMEVGLEIFRNTTRSKSLSKNLGSSVSSKERIVVKSPKTKYGINVTDCEQEDNECKALSQKNLSKKRNKKEKNILLNIMKRNMR